MDKISGLRLLDFKALLKRLSKRLERMRISAI